MRNFYIPVIALMAAVSVLPAVAQRTNSSTVNRSVVKKSTGDSLAVAGTKVKAVNPWAAAAKKKLLAPAAQGAVNTVDTVMLSKKTSKSNDETDYVETYTYEEHGLRSLIERRYADGSLEWAERYTYTFDANSCWTAKLVESASVEDGEITQWRVTAKEEREVDGNKRVTSRKLYTMTENTPVLSKAVSYDYEHPVYDDEGNATYGHVSSLTRYNEDGIPSSTYKYEWLESAQQYVQVYYEDFGSINGGYGEKEEAVAIDNGYKTTSYRCNSETGEWVLSSTCENFFILYAPGHILGGGEIYTRYEDGEVSERSGEKIEYAANTPEEGWEQWTEYELSDGDTYEWTPSELCQKYNMPADCDPDDITADKAVRKVYSYTGSGWGEPWVNTYENVGNGLWKITTAYGEQSSYQYYTRSEDGYFSNGDYYTKSDGTGCFFTSTEEGTVGKYFGADGFTGEEVLVKSCRVKVPFNGNFILDSYDQYYTKDSDGEWTAMTEWDVYENGSYYYSSPVFVRKHYTLDSEGRLSRVNEYTTCEALNDGNEYESARTEYAFADKSASVTYYDSNYYKLTLSLYRGTEYLLLDDGTVRKNEYEYENNEVDYAYRTDYNGPVTTSYKYNEKTKELTVSDVSRATSYSETDADGVVTNYEVEYDSDNNPVFISKEEFAYNQKVSDYITRESNASYTYDAAAGKWVGQSKRETYILNYPFKWYDEPIHPDEQYADEYAVMPDTYSGIEDNRSLNTEIFVYGNVDYKWDAENDKWVFEGIGPMNFDWGAPMTLEIIDNNAAGPAVSCSYYRNSAEWHSVDLVTTDDHEPVIISEYTQNDYGDYTEYSSSLKSYAYDEKDRHRLISVNESESRDTSNGDSSDSQNRQILYEYGTYSIVPTSVDRAIAAVLQLSVNGRTVSVPGDAVLSLYDLSGRIIAKGAGRVTAPAAGVYVVKSAAKSCKIAVR